MVEINETLPYFSSELKGEISSNSLIKTIPKDTELIGVGQLIKSIPIVINGLVEVFTKYGEKEFLLYYIQPSESCLLSFITGNKNRPSAFFAKTEEDSTILFMPIHKVEYWLRKYPDFNTMYLNLFNDRYYDLINTLNLVLFEKLDSRLYMYLKNKSRASNTIFIQLGHKDIAFELGTSREVITRVLKKLELENKVVQTKDGIKVISGD